MTQKKVEGYCPEGAFSCYLRTEDNVPENAEKAVQLLGQRIRYLVYDLYQKAKFNHDSDYCYAVDAICGANGTLGIEIATALRVLVPVFDSLNDQKIYCFDVQDLSEIPALVQNADNFSWSIKPQLSYKAWLFKDNRFIAVIENQNNSLKLYLYKRDSLKEQ